MRLWPAVRAARLMHSADELVRFAEAGPWRVRVTDAGEAMVLDRWRDHLGYCGIKGLWAAQHRISDHVEHAGSVARVQGFDGLLSPLLSRTAARGYIDAGMSVHERIVALQAELVPGGAGDRSDAGGPQLQPVDRVRRATQADLGALETLDAESFDEFWRYGPRELTVAIDAGEVFIAEKDGRPVGYSTVAVFGATATVGRLAVAENSRRGGVGGALLRDAARRAADAGAETVNLCTQEHNRASRALYFSAGMVELPEQYVICAKRLDDSPVPVD